MAEHAPILGRLWRAKAKMLTLGGARGIPNAFYLGPESWAEFMATDPPEITAQFRGKPRLERGYEGIPVRPSQGKDPDYRQTDRLFSLAGTSVTVLR